MSCGKQKRKNTVSRVGLQGTSSHVKVAVSFGESLHAPESLALPNGDNEKDCKRETWNAFELPRPLFDLLLHHDAIREFLAGQFDAGFSLFE
jgi:hypothetical protein